MNQVVTLHAPRTHKNSSAAFEQLAGVFASCGAAKPHGSGGVTDETPKRSVEHKALHLNNLRKLRAAKGEHVKHRSNYESISYAPRINCHRETATKKRARGKQPHATTAPIAKSNSTNRKKRPCQSQKQQRQSKGYVKGMP